MSESAAEAPGPSYDVLRQQAAARWRDASSQYAPRLEQMQAAVQEMPDVQHAPPRETPYTHPAITCLGTDCHGTVFYVEQWACCNGVVQRAVLTCQTCRQQALWNFQRMEWTRALTSPSAS